MAWQLADLVTVQTNRAAALWAAEPDGPEAAEAPVLLDSVVMALAGKGDERLLAAAGLTAEVPDSEVAPRLDALMRRLEGLARSAEHLAAEAPTTEREALRHEVADLQRRLATRTAAMVAARAAELREGRDAKGAALSVTVHELRRPLTILTSYTEMLNDGTLGELPPPAASALRGMADAAEVMSHLIESLSEVARLEDPDDEPAIQRFRLGDLVREAAGEVDTERELRGIGLDLDIDPDVELRGDRPRLRLALTNLLSNAIKHSPPHSSVEVHSARNDGVLRLSVIDHGPGFPPHEAERLFEKYYRSAVERNSGIPGTGLGLFIVKTVAERHGGSVAARLAREGGAEFEITVPVG